MYNRQTGTVSIPSHKQNLLVHTLINVVLRKISMVSLILLWRLKSFWDFISKKGPKRHGRILVNFGLFPDRFLEIFEFWGTNFVSVLSEIGEFRWDPVISKPNPRSLFSTTNDAFRVTLTAWVFFFICLLTRAFLNFRISKRSTTTDHLSCYSFTLYSLVGSIYHWFQKAIFILSCSFLYSLCRCCPPRLEPEHGTTGWQKPGCRGQRHCTSIWPWSPPMLPQSSLWGWPDDIWHGKSQVAVFVVATDDGSPNGVMEEVYVWPDPRGKRWAWGRNGTW